MKMKKKTKTDALIRVPAAPFDAFACPRGEDIAKG
jgi:hypothetical protein